MQILKNRKFKLAIISLCAVMVLCVGGTFAYLKAATNTTVNLFNHGVVNITTDEKFPKEDRNIANGPVVKMVRIKNDSLENKLNVVPVYVRVNIVATWVNTDGSIAPVNAYELLDYKLNLGSSLTDEKVVSADVSGDWILGDDGYYYFTGIVERDCFTDYLLTEVTLKEGATVQENGHLEINVLADAVNAKADSVNKAWSTPIDVNTGLQIFEK